MPHDPSPPHRELPADVVARVRAGDMAAFEALFRAEHAPLCGYAFRLTDDRALAEELVQDLFADLWSKRDAWRVEGSVRGYLFAAVRNRALNARRRRVLEMRWAQEEAGADTPSLHNPPAPADAELHAAELRAELRAALDSLPERRRAVMELRWLERLSHAEIARTLGISVKGVEIQLSRGLQSLRDYFGRR